MAIADRFDFTAERGQQLLRHQQVDRVVLDQQHSGSVQRLLRRFGVNFRCGHRCRCRRGGRGHGQGRAQLGIGRLPWQHGGIAVQLLGHRRLVVQPHEPGGAAGHGALQCGGAVAQCRQVGDQAMPQHAIGGAAQLLQCFVHVANHVQGEAPVRQQQLQPPLQAWVVADQQHLRQVAGGLVQVAGYLQQRDLEPEGGTLAGAGLQADLAVHQVDDALADDQPQAGAAIQPGGGCVGLGEGVEQPLLLRGVDADAGVAYLEAQQVLGFGFAQPLHAQLHAAALGELDGVDHQVAQYLAQPGGVATHRQAHRRIQRQAHLQALVLGAALHQLQL